MDSQTQHFQTQAVAILAITTAALGFGLFGAEFRVSTASTDPLPLMRLVAAGYAVVIHVAQMRSVRHILESTVVTGRDVVLGPLTYMFLVVLLMVSIFAAGILDRGPGYFPHS